MRLEWDGHWDARLQQVANMWQGWQLVTSCVYQECCKHVSWYNISSPSPTTRSQCLQDKGRQNLNPHQFHAALQTYDWSIHGQPAAARPRAQTSYLTSQYSCQRRKEQNRITLAAGIGKAGCDCIQIASKARSTWLWHQSRTIWPKMYTVCIWICARHQLT
jgi:hypothetical protein